MRSAALIKPPPRRWLIPALLFLLTLLAYLPTLRCGFIWDDDALITQSRGVIDPNALRGLAYLWSGKAPFDYFPLTQTLFWIEYHLWGANPTPFHVITVLLHALDVVLFWLVLRRLRIPGAALAAALLAIHPLFVESVAWVAEHKNTLSLVLFLITILLWLRYQDEGDRTAEQTNRKITKEKTRGSTRGSTAERAVKGASARAQRRRLGWLLAAWAVYTLALLAKTSVIMLPCDLLLIAWWRRGRLSLRTLVETLPFFALSLLLGLVTIHFQAAQRIDAAILRRPPLERLAQAGVNIWFYPWKLLAPLHLATFYPELRLRGVTALVLLPAIAWMVLLAALAAAALRRRAPAARGALLAALFYTLNILPVLGMVNMAWTADSVVGNHLAYLPLLGPLALLGAGGAALAARFSAIRRALHIGGAEVGVILLILTWRQIGFYRSPITLWNHDIAVAPNSANAHASLGLELVKTGDPVGAIREWNRAIALDPRNVRAQSNLAELLVDRRQYAAALPHLAAALALFPDNLPLVTADATAELHFNRPAVARAAYRHFLQRWPNSADAWLAYGSTCEQTNQLPQAIDAYQHAAALAPANATPCYNMGNVYVSLNMLPQAVASYREAVRRDPAKAQAWFNLAIVLHSLRQDEPAQQAIQRALQLDPSLAHRPRP